MPSISEHHSKASDNLQLVEQINTELNADWWDWQVTVIFYSALHIVNCYLAKHNLHYNTHEKVNQALNPYNQLSLTKIDEPTYAAYESLKNLSRRARYLVHESKNNTSSEGFFTHDKHFAKAVRNYEIVAQYFESKHGIKVPSIKVNCLELTQNGTYEINKTKAKS